MRWTRQVTKIKRQLKAVEKRKQALLKKAESLEDALMKARVRLRPYWDQLNIIKTEQAALENKLATAEQEVLIEQLKIGSKLWILHDPIKLTQGFYETITEQKAKLLSKKQGKFKPREITVTAISTDPDLITAKADRQLYSGHIRRDVTPPTIVWTRKKR